MVSKSFQKEGGFTLLELMVVVAVIAVLAAIAFMQYQKFTVRAFDTAAKSDLRNSMIALEAYFSYQNVYPATSTELQANGLKQLSQNVSFKKYEVEAMTGGGQTVHMHVKHSGSPNTWHANYPEEGSTIEIR